MAKRLVLINLGTYQLFEPFSSLLFTKTKQNKTTFYSQSKKQHNTGNSDLF